MTKHECGKINTEYKLEISVFLKINFLFQNNKELYKSDRLRANVWCEDTMESELYQTRYYNRPLRCALYLK